MMYYDDFSILLLPFYDNFYDDFYDDLLSLLLPFHDILHLLVSFSCLLDFYLTFL